MRFSTFFSKRNYEYFYYLIKPFPKGVKNHCNSYDRFINLSSIIDYINVKDYKKIVVVASGPSAKKLKLEDDTLYFTTNNAIKLVKSVPYIYVVNDSYYLMKYLKTFKSSIEWQATFFWYVSTTSRIREYAIKCLSNYLKTKSRNKKEFLITNVDESFCLKSVHNEVVGYLKSNLNINYYGVNSGFVTLVLAYVISDISNKEIEIYGLDMGEKGGGYFDKQVQVGKSINGDKSKEIVREFLLKIYQSNDRITNYSNFMNYDKRK